MARPLWRVGLVAAGSNLEPFCLYHLVFLDLLITPNGELALLFTHGEHFVFQALRADAKLDKKDYVRGFKEGLFDVTYLFAHLALGQIDASDFQLVLSHLVLVHAHHEVASEDGLLLELAELEVADGGLDECLAREVLCVVHLGGESEVNGRRPCWVAVCNDKRCNIDSDDYVRMGSLGFAVLKDDKPEVLFLGKHGVVDDVLRWQLVIVLHRTLDGVLVALDGGVELWFENDDVT